MHDPVALSLAGGVLEVDLEAVCSNYDRLSRVVAPALCAAVVKADAYGLGATPVSRRLYDRECRDFFVAHAAERLSLRVALPAEAMIFVLNGLQPGAEPASADAGLVPVLNSLEQIAGWGAEAARRGGAMPAAVQVDSGMSRLGLMPAEVDALLREPRLLDGIDVRLVMSHLACADEPEHPSNAAQLNGFLALADSLPDARLSLANSAGALLDAGFHRDLARPGIALYGVNPTPGRDPGLRPVVALHAKVIQVRDIGPGATVGYGAVFAASAEMRVATLAVGYADGWPRHLSGTGAAFWGDVRLPILGRVSMDSMTVDVSALPGGTLRLGDLVELIGPHQTLDDVAARADTIPYEILTNLGRRYARRYVGMPGAIAEQTETA